MISVVIPLFNEKERLPATLRELECFVRENPLVIGEVVLVDDGSSDGSLDKAMYFLSRLPSLKLERFVKNRGKWAALHYGVSVAKHDAVLLLDADGSASVYELSRIRKLRELLREKRVIFGSRFMEGSCVEGKSWFRSLLSTGYRWYGLFWYWYATGRRDVSDLQCPFKLVYKSRMDVGKLCVERFAGDIELACMVGGDVLNVPVEFVHKAGSRVKASSLREMLVETVKVAVRYRKLLKSV
jgi:dolichyl-phosphate beta-glucosyltransferase